MNTLTGNRIKPFKKSKLGILERVLPSLYSVDIAAPIKTETLTMSKDRPRIDSLLEEKIDQGVLTATNSAVIVKAYRMLIRKNTAERRVLAAEVSASAEVLAAAAHVLAQEEESLVEASSEGMFDKEAEKARSSTTSPICHRILTSQL